MMLYVEFIRKKMSFNTHFPWLFLPEVTHGNLGRPPNLHSWLARYGKHVRHALIGFASSVVADTLCNPIRVLKVNRQASLTRTSSLAFV